MDRLRTLVEQSELWVYKKRESSSSYASLTTLTTPNVIEIVETTVTTPSNSLSASMSDSCASQSLHQTFSRHRRLSSTTSHSANELDDGPSLSPQSLAKYKELYEILSSMTTLCLTGTKRKNDQRLLRNMGVHLSVLDLTKISYDRLSDSRMRVIMREAHRFLQTFCLANKHNQVLLHDKIDFAHFPANDWEAATGVAIFKDNLELCQSVSERLIQNYVHGLGKF